MRKAGQDQSMYTVHPAELTAPACSVYNASVQCRGGMRTLGVSSRVFPSFSSAKSVTLRVLRRLRPARCSPSAAAPSSLPASIRHHSETARHRYCMLPRLLLMSFRDWTESHGRRHLLRERYTVLRRTSDMWRACTPRAPGPSASIGSGLGSGAACPSSAFSTGCGVPPSLCMKSSCENTPGCE